MQINVAFRHNLTTSLRPIRHEAAQRACVVEISGGGRDLVEISHNLALAFEESRIVKVLFDMDDRQLLSLYVSWI